MERLDRAGESYYLVVFGTPAVSVGVATVDVASGALRSSARLTGNNAHRVLEPDEAAAAAGSYAGGAATLVWCPCPASRSPFYPLWRVDTAAGPVFVDQERRVWTSLDLGGGRA